MTNQLVDEDTTKPLLENIIIKYQESASEDFVNLK